VAERIDPIVATWIDHHSIEAKKHRNERQLLRVSTGTAGHFNINDASSITKECGAKALGASWPAIWHRPRQNRL
jgi:hypothetical protein